MASSTWGEGWGDRIAGRLAQLGVNSIGSYLAAFPGESFLDLARRLGNDVAAVQLQSLYVAEAQRSGQVRQACKEVLARSARAQFPGGWNTGESVEFRRAGVAGKWCGDLVMLLGREVETQLWQVWRALLRAEPPTGWLPSDGSDPLIAAAFDEGWPT